MIEEILPSVSAQENFRLNGGCAPGSYPAGAVAVEFPREIPRVHERNFFRDLEGIRAGIINSYLIPEHSFFLAWA